MGTRARLGLVPFLRWQFAVQANEKEATDGTVVSFCILGGCVLRVLALTDDSLFGEARRNFLQQFLQATQALDSGVHVHDAVGANGKPRSSFIKSDICNRCSTASPERARLFDADSDLPWPLAQQVIPRASTCANSVSRSSGCKGRNGRRGSPQSRPTR